MAAAVLATISAVMAVKALAMLSLSAESMGILLHVLLTSVVLSMASAEPLQTSVILAARTDATQSPARVAEKTRML